MSAECPGNGRCAFCQAGVIDDLGQLSFTLGDSPQDDGIIARLAQFLAQQELDLVVKD